MNIKQIEYFEIAYQERSFSKAAKKLFITQQNVSKTIKSLEDELGKSLFIRKATGIVPTGEGEFLHLKALKLLGIRNEITDYFLSLKKSQQSSLRIGLSHGLSYFFNDRFFKSLKDYSDTISFKIIDLFNSEIEQKLRNKEIDIGITVAPAELGSLEIVHLFNEPIYCVVNKKHRFAKKQILEFDEIINEKLIMVNGNYTSYHNFRRKCQESGKKPEWIETTDLFEIYETVMRENCVGFTLKSLKDFIRFNDIIHIPLDDDEALWDVSLIYESESVCTKMIDTFIEYCKDYNEKNWQNKEKV